MQKKIGSLILLTALITGCTQNPPQDDFAAISSRLEQFKIDAPQFHKYPVKGLESLVCDENKGICTMSVADLRQNQHDKRSLFELYSLSHSKDVIRVEAYNSLVDAMMHNEVALAKKERSIDRLELALRKERTFNAVKTWLERALFIGGAYIFSLM
jgi:hypothetical protein